MLPDDGTSLLGVFNRGMCVAKKLSSKESFGGDVEY